MEPVASTSASFNKTHPTQRVLSLYYPQIRTLASLFPCGLLKEKDSERFNRFLHESLVASTLSDPIAFDALADEDRSFGMSEILQQVLQIVFKRHATEYHEARRLGLPAFSTPKNVLAAGHRLTTIGNDNQRVRMGTGPSFESVHTNTVAASIVHSKDWSTLLSRVGPDAIIQLLSSNSIALFQPLKNGCYLQLSGVPVVELKILERPTNQGRQKEKKRKFTTSDEGERKGGRKTHVRSVKKRGKRKKKENGELETKEDGTGKDRGGQAIKQDESLVTSEQDRAAFNMDRDLSLATSVNGPSQLPEDPIRPVTEMLLAPGDPRSTSAERPSDSHSVFAAQTQVRRPPQSIPKGPTATRSVPAAMQARGKKVNSRQVLPKQEQAKKIASPPNSIVFSRHRIYHARLSKNQRGKIVYGLSPKHILSRLSETFVVPKTVYPPSIPPAAAVSASSASKPTKQAVAVVQSASHFYASARHLSKHVFPKLFRLDNVFEREKVNVWMRVRPDYEDRQVEIKKLGTVKTPSRLKPQVVPLLNKLIVLHYRCNHRKLLDLKSPSKVAHREMDEAEKQSLITDLMSEAPGTQMSRTNMPQSTAVPLSSAVTAKTDSQVESRNPTSSSRSSNQQIPDSQVNEETSRTIQGDSRRDESGDDDSLGNLRPIKLKSGLERKPKLAEFACTPYEVESYVQAVVRDVIPKAFWGSDRNQKLMFKQISQFLRMRRFESISLHSLLQGFSILDCEWLDCSSPSESLKYMQQSQKDILPKGGDPKPSKRIDAVELEKRKMVLAEFLYWVFDSFITDLVRTAFYVTDSATHQNRPLYFRQDDWKALTAPLLEALGKTVFERVPDNQVIALERQPRELGLSYVRLLPKEAGVRPIVNLARRPIRIGVNGEKEVGQPINQILRSVFDVLTFESKRKPDLVGSLVSNPQEIYAKLKGYKTHLLESDASGSSQLPELYFVKVDVKSCFDTIKQDKLLALVEDILSETLYYIQKYSQVVAYSGKSARMFKRQACGDDDLGSFQELAMQLAEDLHDVILTDQVRYDDVGRDKLMALLREHITTNLVKVNGHLYRQKDGIPQGSILSSLLCSLFYGDMEKNCLAFTQDTRSVLMRYVDDFMFVTTKKHLAVRFLQTMNNGIPDYGCFVSSEKRLTNFDVSLVDGELVPPLPRGEDFGYCGLAIDTETLEIKMNLQLQMNKEIVNQLTVQRYRKPGEAFIGAMFRAVKVRAHSMYTDTNFNSTTTVYSNIYQAMLVVALKYQAYVREWCGSLRGKVVFFWNAIQKIVKYEFSALVRQGNSRKAAKLSASFGLERSHVIWLGYHAFHRVLARRPAIFAPLLRLLLAEIRSPAVRRHLATLEKVTNAQHDLLADKGSIR